MGLFKEMYKYIRNKINNSIDTIIKYISIILIIILIITIFSFKINQYSYTISRLNSSIMDLSIKINQLQYIINNIEYDIIVECNHDIIEKDYSSYVKSHMKIPEDHIQIGIDIMESYNIDPVLLFSIVDARSKGDLFKYTSDPTVRGYGLMTEGTSRWIYEDIMSRRGYSNDMQNDGIISMQILAEYIAYLMKIHNGNIKELTYSYIGSKNDSLYIEIKKYIDNLGMNISLIEYNYINKGRVFKNE